MLYNHATLETDQFKEIITNPNRPIKFTPVMSGHKLQLQRFFFFRHINKSINIYISFNWYVHSFILIISEHLFVYKYIFSCLLFCARWLFFVTRQLFMCGWRVLDWFVCPCFRPVVFLLVQECHALESTVFVFTVWVSKIPAVHEEEPIDQRVTVEHSCMPTLSLSFIFNLKGIELSSACSQ